MATIYKLTDDILFIQKLIEDGVPEEEFAEALKRFDGELTEKLEGYAMVIKNIESDIEGLKAEEKRLDKRRKAMENSVKRMKENMQYSMVATGQLKVKGEKFNFTVQKNPPSLKVLDEALIPIEFINVETVRTIDRKTLMERLKANEIINGVEISQGESIRIR